MEDRGASGTVGDNMTERTDLELLRDYVDWEDEQAFAQLVVRHAPMIYRFRPCPHPYSPG